MAESLIVKPPRSWGRSTVHTACPLDCPDSCSLSVTVQRGRLTEIAGDRRMPATEGYICDKVRRFDRRVYSPDRVLHPSIRTGPKGSGHFRRAAWDEALDLVAARMAEARETLGAEAVLPYSGGASNGLLTNALEDARLFRRFGASRLTHTSSDGPATVAAAAMYGNLPGVVYADYEHARLIVIWGANPSAPGVHLVTHIKRAQAAGARVVVIDPRRTATAALADLHLPVRPGTDLGVALAVIAELFARGWADETFLSRHATGVEELRSAAAAWPLERAAAEAGVDVAALRTFAEWYGTTSPAVIRCGRGQASNRNGGSATLAILALPAVGGKFGVRGGGYTLNNAAAWNIDIEQLIDTPEPATRVVTMNQLGRALTTLTAPPVSVLFVYNSNPLSTAPNQNLVREGLAREDSFTVVLEQTMTDTAAFADVLLPATTFLEHYDITRGTGAYHLHLVQPVIAPTGEARPNHDVFRELGVRMGLTAADDELGEAGALLETTARLPEDLATAILEGAPAPAPGGGRPVQFSDVFPKTPDALIHLFPSSLAAARPLYDYAPDPATSAYPLALITPASARTISSTLGELRPGIAHVRMHPDDAHARLIGEADTVRVFNDLGEVQCTAVVTPEIWPGTVSLPKGLWAKSTFNGASATALAPDSPTDIGEGACFNDARVNIALWARHG